MHKVIFSRAIFSRAFFPGIIFLFFSVQILAQGLQTQLTPGGVFVGQTDPKSRIIYQDMDVMVDKEGRFIIGFGRDASLTQHYVIASSDGQRQKMTLTLTPRKYKIERITGVARKYVTPAEHVLKRIRDDSKAVRNARTGGTWQHDLFNGFDWPVTGRISGVYGSQRVYNGKPGRPHYGLDVAVPTGTAVSAPADGVVKLTDADLYYSGGTIIIDHGFGIFSSFLHLSKISVKAGQKITRGDIIGEVGATGRVTGPHLDWRYNWFNERLDPKLLTLSEQ